jgi:Domain of unknown function (DUF4395)
MAISSAATRPTPGDVPMPIVRLNRWVLVVGIVLGLLPAVVIGQRASLIFRVGKRLFARQLPTAEREDRRLMRFNNTIALALLGLAQVAFLIGAPLVGWVLAGMVAGAAGVALAGFCVGCFIYYQLKLNRYRLLGIR